MALPDPINYPALDPNPTLERSSLGGVFVPKRSPFFLGLMMRAVSASNARLLHFIPGTILHRLFSVVSESLEHLSFDMQEVGVRAIHESAYAAFTDPVLFPPRGNATFARGSLRLSLPDPAQNSELILAGTMATTRDGRVVQVAEDTLFPQFASQALIPVVCQTPGAAGNIQAGEIARLLGGTRASYQVSNPSAIAGGQDTESDTSLYRRFQDFIESRATGNRLAVYSAGKNARAAGEVVQDAALISPWTLKDLNQEMGYGLLVIDNGSGGASTALVAAAQVGVNLVVSALEQVLVVPADAYVVSPSIEVRTTRTAPPADVEAAVRLAWQVISGAALIEDGRGRGLVRLYDVAAALDKAHPEVLDVRLLNLTADLQPTIGARLVSGVLTVTVLRGDGVRP